MTPHLELDPSALLRQVAEVVPSNLLQSVVVIGSIASAWAFRDLPGNEAVATKDVDLVLSPAIAAIGVAESLGQALIGAGWTPRFPADFQPGSTDTPVELLPVLRLSPPGGEAGWFLELLAHPANDQATRKQWHRFHTSLGSFVLPSFRYVRVAIHDPEETRFGIRVARPACMALAHLLEHAEPDRTPISGLPGNPPRFTKDVGRAVSLWWLARQESPLAGQAWSEEWKATLSAVCPGQEQEHLHAARSGLEALANYQHEAHRLASAGLLAGYGVSREAWDSAVRTLHRLIHDCRINVD